MLALLPLPQLPALLLLVLPPVPLLRLQLLLLLLLHFQLLQRAPLQQVQFRLQLLLPVPFQRFPQLLPLLLEPLRLSLQSLLPFLQQELLPRPPPSPLQLLLQALPHPFPPQDRLPPRRGSLLRQPLPDCPHRLFQQLSRLGLQRLPPVPFLPGLQLHQLLPSFWPPSLSSSVLPSLPWSLAAHRDPGPTSEVHSQLPCHRVPASSDGCGKGPPPALVGSGRCRRVGPPSQSIR